MRTALVYDRVNKWGGAERVLLTLHELFPKAPLYTAVYNKKTAPWADVFPKVVPSFLQKFPVSKERHDLYAPLMPLAFESFDFSQYDLVISVTSEAAKGIITKPGTRHICYCLTPTRYLWSGYNFYFNTRIKRALSAPAVSYLRTWDKVAAQRPDIMVGISKAVVGRIWKYYGRQAKLVYPPVETDKFEARNSKHETGEYFLVVSRLVPYKKVDLVVEVFNRLNKKLVVVGAGSEERKLKQMAKDNIDFIGEVGDEELVQYYSGCLALISPQEEDFGIANVEAQAAGKPVIAYKKGGALETIVGPSAGSGPATGIFFSKQTQRSLEDAIKRFNPRDFKPGDARDNAEKFSKEKFLREFATLVSTLSKGE